MMRGVSRTLRPPLLALLLAFLAVCGGAAIAGASSLEDAIDGALLPSPAAPLLGPITSRGRVGWECKPERSAAAAQWHEAELPHGSGTL
jgi:hypothetical protein